MICGNIFSDQTSRTLGYTLEEEEEDGGGGWREGAKERKRQKERKSEMGTTSQMNRVEERPVKGK